MPRTRRRVSAPRTSKGEWPPPHGGVAQIDFMSKPIVSLVAADVGLPFQGAIRGAMLVRGRCPRLRWVRPSAWSTPFGLSCALRPGLRPLRPGPTRSEFVSLKGWTFVAEGNALGPTPFMDPALKGQPNIGCHVVLEASGSPSRHAQPRKEVFPKEFCAGHVGGDERDDD